MGTMHFFNDAGNRYHFLLFQTEAGKNQVGSKQERGRERKEESDEKSACG
jgi:hypothetical protein